MIDDAHPTDSSTEQLEVERDVHELYRALWKHVRKSVDRDEAFALRSTQHAGFFAKTFGTLQGVASFPPVHAKPYEESQQHVLQPGSPLWIHQGRG